MTTTKPTTITPAQYAAASIAHNPETFDIFLLWQDETGADYRLWVGQDKRSTENSNPDTNLDCYSEAVWMTDENGNDYLCENAWVCSTKKCWADLHLDDLANGQITWI